MTRICECGHERRDHVKIDLIRRDFYFGSCDILDCACEAYSESVDLTAEADQQLRREQQDQI